MTFTPLVLPRPPAVVQSLLHQWHSAGSALPHRDGAGRWWHPAWLRETTSRRQVLQWQLSGSQCQASMFSQSLPYPSHDVICSGGGWICSWRQGFHPFVRPGGPPTRDRESRRTGDVSMAMQGSWYPFGKPLLLRHHHAGHGRRTWEWMCRSCPISACTGRGSQAPQVTGSSLGSSQSHISNPHLRSNFLPRS